MLDEGHRGILCLRVESPDLADMPWIDEEQNQICFADDIVVFDAVLRIFSGDVLDYKSYRTFAVGHKINIRFLRSPRISGHHKSRGIGLKTALVRCVMLIYIMIRRFHRKRLCLSALDKLRNQLNDIDCFSASRTPHHHDTYFLIRHEYIGLKLLFAKRAIGACADALRCKAVFRFVLYQRRKKGIGRNIRTFFITFDFKNIFLTQQFYDACPFTFC